MDHRNDWLSFEAFEVVQRDESEVLARAEETRWRLEDAVERARAREEAQGGRFRGGPSTGVRRAVSK